MCSMTDYTISGMRLVYESVDKNPQKFQCEEHVHIDFKEFFYVNGNDGWKDVVIPNEAEKREYGNEENSISKGVVAFCLKLCNWNKCPVGNIDVAGILAENAKIEINGLRVDKFTKLHSGSTSECVLAGHSNDRTWLPNSDGHFVISAHVETPGFFLRFTSFIVWYATDNM